MQHFHIERVWSQAGYFETERLVQFREDVMAAIMAGDLIAISGPVGVGKTVMINRLQDQITADKKIIVARSLSVDKPRVVLPALITALFLDITGDPDMKVPTQPERREFVSWLLGQCLADNVDPSDVFEDAAQEYLAERLSTPLQFAEHLNRAFTDAYRMGADQVTRDIVEETISVGFDDLDARLSRIGYSPKALADLTDTRLPEIRRFLKGQLDTDRTDELSTLMRKAGLPI